MLVGRTAPWTAMTRNQLRAVPSLCSVCVSLLPGPSSLLPGDTAPQEGGRLAGPPQPQPRDLLNPRPKGPSSGPPPRDPVTQSPRCAPAPPSHTPGPPVTTVRGNGTARAETSGSPTSLGFQCPHPAGSAASLLLLGPVFANLQVPRPPLASSPAGVNRLPAGPSGVHAWPPGRLCPDAPTRAWSGTCLGPRVSGRHSRPLALQPEVGPLPPGLGSS